MFPSLCYYGPSVAPFAGLKAIIGRSAVKDSPDNWWVWVVWEDGELSCETLDNLCRYVPTLKRPDVETLARSQPLFYYKTSDNQERRKVAPRSHWEGLSPKISGILEKAKADRVPKKAAEEPKPLSFATPNPWSALPREVYVGKGRDKKEGATTESPVDGQDQPRMYKSGARSPPGVTGRAYRRKSVES